MNSMSSYPDMPWRQIQVQILRDKDTDIHQSDQGMCDCILHYLRGIHLSLQIMTQYKISKQ